MEKQLDVCVALTSEQETNLKENLRKLKNGEMKFNSREQVFNKAYAKFGLTPKQQTL